MLTWTTWFLDDKPQRAVRNCTRVLVCDPTPFLLPYTLGALEGSLFQCWRAMCLLLPKTQFPSPWAPEEPIVFEDAGLGCHSKPGRAVWVWKPFAIVKSQDNQDFAFIFRLYRHVFLKTEELYPRSRYFSLCLCRSSFRKEKDGMKLRNLPLDLACGFCVRISKWPPSPILLLSVDDSLGPQAKAAVVRPAPPCPNC